MVAVHQEILQKVRNRTHNPKVDSSSLSPATKEYITRTIAVLVIFLLSKKGESPKNGK